MNDSIENDDSLSKKADDPQVEVAFEEWRTNLFQKKSMTISFFEKCRHKVSQIIWRQYGHLVYLYSRNILKEMSKNLEFMKNEVKVGCISSGDLELLRNCVENAPKTMPEDAEDSIPGYYSNSYGKELTDAWSDSLREVDLRNAAKELQRIFSNIASEISECFGHPFRIVNVGGIGIMPSAAGIGNAAWHKDGLPPGMYRVLIYVNKVDKDSGSTEIKMHDGSSMVVEGPPGTWLLFNPTTLMHRGLPANSGERIVIYTMVVPAFKENQEPVFAGINSNFPWFPWSVPKSHS